MTTASFILAVSIPVMPLWAGDTPLVELIKDLKASTDTIGIQVLGSQLAECEPKTETELKLLFEVFKDTALAPYTQSAVSNVKDPALGPMLIKELQAMKAGLKDISNEELMKLPPEQESKLMMEAMNLAAVVHPLGKLKYTPAAPDLRMLLSYDEAYQGYIAWAASEALGRMGDEEAYQMLMADLERRKTVTVSGYGRKAIPAIVAKIDRIHESYKIRPHQINDPRAEQIGDLAAKISCPSRNDNESKRLLLGLTDHVEYEVRHYAAKALVACMDHSDKAFTRSLLSNRDDSVRLQGFEALVLRGTWDKAFMPVVIDMIQHDLDEGVRGSAIALLRRLIMAGVRRSELQDSVPYLKAALTDSSLLIRGAAFDALRAITGNYYPYEGMSRWDRAEINRGPAYLPEDTSRSFYGKP